MYFPGDVVQEGRMFETSVYNYKYIVQDYSYSWVCFMHYSHYLRTAEKLHNSVPPWLCHSANETRLTTWMWGLKPRIKPTRKAPFLGGKARQSLGLSDFHFYNFPDLTCNLLAGFNLALEPFKCLDHAKLPRLSNNNTEHSQKWKELCCIYSVQGYFLPAFRGGCGSVCSGSEPGSQTLWGGLWCHQGFSMVEKELL